MAPTSQIPPSLPSPFAAAPGRRVVIMMDFHAHCSSAEVGGLLAGAFDPAARTLTISRAFPVLEVQQAVSASGPGTGAARPPVAVEFDRTDLARVLEVIRNWGLQCIGSYRSHPAYAATPNALDVLYAARTQAEARTADGDEPCVCAIISPFDPAASPGECRAGLCGTYGGARMRDEVPGASARALDA